MTVHSHKLSCRQQYMASNIGSDEVCKDQENQIWHKLMPRESSGIIAHRSEIIFPWRSAFTFFVIGRVHRVLSEFLAESFGVIAHLIHLASLLI
ncbi:hypothetical protein OSTOST_07425 [Ostertagia ostertagi]